MKRFLYFSCAVALVLSLASCKKNGNDDNNSDSGKTDPSSIATENLVAYIPFDGDGVEKIANITPKTEKVTFADGRRGQGLKGAEGGYLLYNLPTDSKIRNLKAYSVAFWLKQDAIQNGQVPVPMYFQITSGSDHYNGNVSVTGERLYAPSDSLLFKNIFRKSGAEWEVQDVRVTKPSFVAGKWGHYVIRYDNVKSEFKLYVNGVCPLDPEKDADIINRYAKDADEEGNQPALGDLKFLDADKIIIGAWLPKVVDGATDEWMGDFTGNMDELRLYDRALTDAEVKTLYDAEVENLN